MAVCRVEKTKNYTVLSNYHLQDERLTLKAKGLLSIMLSLPERWDYTIAGLASLCREGKDAIRSGVEELERCGYIRRRQLHAEDGSFADNEYIIYEAPQADSPSSERILPLSENPTTADNKRVSDDPPGRKTPLSGNPLTDNPLTGNPTQSNTYLSKYLSNNTPLTPQKLQTGKSLPAWKPERFAAFWQFYPRGESKQAAVRAWDKLKPDDSLIGIMGQALIRQKATEEWQRGVGIPYAATWLNQRRWEDDLKMPGKTPSDCVGGWAPDPEVI